MNKAFMFPNSAQCEHQQYDGMKKHVALRSMPSGAIGKFI